MGDDQDGTVLCLPNQNQVYLLMFAQKACIWEQSRKIWSLKDRYILGPHGEVDKGQGYSDCYTEASVVQR